VRIVAGPKQRRITSTMRKFEDDWTEIDGDIRLLQHRRVAA